MQAKAIKTQIGPAMAVSMRFVLGPAPTFVSVDGETATLLFPNGAQLKNLPLRDLIDESR